MKSLFIPIALTVLLSGCHNRSTFQVTENDVMHHRYQLISYNNQSIITHNQDILTLEFGEHMYVSGSMCNRFHGQTKIENGILKGHQMAMTRMFCNEPLYNSLDRAINQIFNNGAKITLQDKTLTLTTEGITLIYALSDYVN